MSASHQTQAQVQQAKQKRQEQLESRKVLKLVSRHPDAELLIRVLGLDGAPVRVAKGRYQP